MNVTNTWVSTGSGRKVYPFDPNKSDFDIEDIARNLAKINRWSGNTYKPYSVAQHSVHCANFFKKNPHKALCALLHDASEAYIADIPRPIKAVLPDYQRMETDLQNAIYAKWGVDHTNKEVIDSVRAADDYMLFAERETLFDQAVMKPIWKDWALVKPVFPEAPTKLNVYPWTWRYAEQRFLNTFARLYK